MQRRLVLASAITLGGAALWGLNRPKSDQHGTPRKQPETTLASMIDTLVPRDEFPGGIDIGLDQTIAQQMAQQPKLNQLIARLLPIIERSAVTEYHRAFYRLTIDQREAQLSKHWYQSTNPIVRRDFMQFRRHVLAQYYESPIGQQSMGYQHPTTYPNYHVE
ncbi:gluconate 2-dehydrogenase subunit 3-like protein [Arenicella xantha]|uniref:Gluconate 2-dehydrogenase subunit 3-like protein n=2 Tax=Arenicella xantha TaxID=644221 RepID=A0A395JPD1_9GAMM|nr:gluconate 2-dehydrogenase subunit 3-like protein [Arenicella xantha]